MKAIKKIGLLMVFALAMFTFACGAHGEGAEYTSAYVCPMHCEGSGSDEMGQCPVCGMDYVAQAEHTDDGHAH
ncbi:MAG TPA: heavy metal-binding domain-containing protein [Saprospiraceae bacterium]|nr:heavy metal-binding domain-containing protein [Saprospiraceae bacterium]